MSKWSSILTKSLAKVWGIDWDPVGQGHRRYWCVLETAGVVPTLTYSLTRVTLRL